MTDIPQNAMGVPPMRVNGPCVFGGDVRPNSWDCCIGDVAYSSETMQHTVRMVFYGKLFDEDQVLFIMRQYNVLVGVIDCRPESTLASRLQKKAAKYGIKIWRSEYNTAPSTIECQENAKEMLLKLDRTLALDHVQYAFQSGLGIVLPQNYRKIASFSQEMTNSVRVFQEHLGKQFWKWVKEGDDHSFHAFGYMLTAVRRSNLLAVSSRSLVGATLGIVEDSAKSEIISIETGSTRTVKSGGIDWDAIDEADGMHD